MEASAVGCEPELCGNKFEALILLKYKLVLIKNKTVNKRNLSF